MREATRQRNGPVRKADRPRGAGAVARAHPPGPRAVAVGPRAHARASEPSTPSLEASPLLVRVQYEGNGPGGVYRFVPAAVARARGMMTRLCAWRERNREPPSWWRWNKEQKEVWARRAWDQAMRERWRAVVLLVKAKLELVRIGISTVEKEFMADLILPNGETVNVALAKQLHAALSGGSMPMLPMGDT